MRVGPKLRGFLPLVARFVMASIRAAMPSIRHRNTKDGPVGRDATAVFASGDVTPVLEWVGPNDEGEIRNAFAKAIAIRDDGDAFREPADVWLLETLVKVHRTGGGAPYPGVKPAGPPLIRPSGFRVMHWRSGARNRPFVL